VARFATTNDPITAERIAKDCLILPSSGADLETVAKMVDTAMAAGTNHWAWTYFQFAKGLAEYRQGHFAGVVEWTQKALRAPGNASRDAEAWLVLAMAQYQLKQPEEARGALAKGIKIVETKLPKLDTSDLGADWRDWIITHALLREARALIEDQPAPARP
jgi:tetratricopeptide (TPR) repeat protein